MTDPKVHEIIFETVFGFGEYTEETSHSIADAVVGALAVGGFAVVEVDADVVRRVIVEMAKEREGKR